jgi:uncharacterized membrane protein YcaP (DUF421 family)
MSAVLHGAITYFFVWLIFRITGKRTMSDATTFDFVLLLIISETTQSSLTDNDNSTINSFLLITTMIGLDLLLSLIKQRWQGFEKTLDGVPLVILENGVPLTDRLNKLRVDVGDILSAARELQGLERLDQIKYAVLERNGGITVIPLEATR